MKLANGPFPYDFKVVKGSIHPKEKPRKESFVSPEIESDSGSETSYERLSIHLPKRGNNPVIFGGSI